ncbi:hypothetical protein AB0I60_16905 [Actinosynnema sp. NPDC050436]|uniref:hypothetical protein n=1 Tax=Actinosynnema sp. NPDC050436 TaxID=3155659 RepID=UPI0034005785
MDQVWSPEPPHGQQPEEPAGAAAVVAGLLFLPAVTFTLVAALTARDGRAESLDLFVSVPGLLLVPGPLGDIDFAITLSKVVGPVVLVLALLLVSRVRGVRWALTGLGALCGLYYGYALIRLLVGFGARLAVLPIAALLFWAVPAVVAALPVVGRAVRRVAPQPHRGRRR